MKNMSDNWINDGDRPPTKTELMEHLRDVVEIFNIAFFRSGMYVSIYESSGCKLSLRFTEQENKHYYFCEEYEYLPERDMTYEQDIK